MRLGMFPTEGGSFDGVVTEVQTAEEVGFDSCWVCEHHVEGENYWPSPLVRLGGVAGATDRLGLVTAVLLAPLHHPLELCEGCAVLDRMSGGRLEIGVGLGYVRAEFDAFGVPMEERGGRFVESLRLLDQYLSADGPISFDSPFWSFEDVPPNPTAHQEPRPPLWVGGWGEKALQRSARLADGWMPGGTADLEGLVARKRVLDEAAEQAGRDPAELEVPLMREVIVADTHEAAVDRAKAHLHRTYLEEYGTTDWSHPIIGDVDVTDFEALAADRFLVGTPEEIAGDLERYRDRLGTDHVGCRFHHPGMPHEVVLEQIELFGDEVIPAV